MRLGDLDALKEEMDRPFWEKWEWEFICKSIDNAPTVNKCDNCDLMLLERTKGEWIYTPDIHDLTEYEGITCSLCGYDSVGDFNFCPNCGADMRGEGNAKT